MGCCFSKELSSDCDSEKAGLLQQSAEQPELENKISKALSSLLDALEGEELHGVRHGGSRAAAGAHLWTTAFVRPGCQQGRGLRQSSHLVSSPACPFLTRCEHLQESTENSEGVALARGCDSVSVTCCVSSVCKPGLSEDGRSRRDASLSCVLGPRGRGVQEAALVRSHLGQPPATGARSVAVDVEMSSDVSSSGTPGRGVKAENPVCVDHEARRRERACKLYSICVVDPDCLDVAGELGAPECEAAAVEDSRSAVTSEAVRRGAWPPLRATQGPGQLDARQEELSPRGVPRASKVTAVFKENATPGFELMTMSLRAHTYAGFSKDHTESGALCDVGVLPKGGGSADCARGAPEERESGLAGRVSPMAGAHVHLLTVPSEVERCGEPGAVAASVGWSASSEKEGKDNSVQPLSCHGSRPESRLLPQALEGIRLSPESHVASLSFGSERLPIHAGCQEAAPKRPGDPGPEHLLGPVMGEGQQQGGCSPKPGGIQPVNKDGSSYQDKEKMSIFEEESHGQRASEWRSSHQVDLCADGGASMAHAHVCDLIGTPCKTHSEGPCQRKGVPELRSSQEVLPDDKTLDGSQCPKSNFISSAFAFTCAEEESETSLSFNPEDEMSVKSIESDRRSLESAGKESLKGSPRETKKNRGSVKSDSENPVKRETRTAPRGAVPSLAVRMCRRPERAEQPGCRSRPTEENHEPRTVKDYGHEDLDLAPPPNQSSGSGERRSQVQEDSLNSDENAGLGPLSSGSAEQSSDALDGGTLGASQPAPAGRGGDRDNIDVCGTSTRAHRVSRRRAVPVLNGTAVHGAMDSVGSPRVTPRELELGETLEGCSCVAGVEAAPVDRYTAPCHEGLQVIPVIPGETAEIAVPPCRDHVLPLTEDAVNIPESPAGGDWQSFPEEVYSQFVNELACYPLGGFVSQLFSEGLAEGCSGYQEGCPWAQTGGRKALEEEQVPNECLHRRPPDLEVALYWMETPPYQLPVAEDAVIWGWQNRGGQLVSMIYQSLLLCCERQVFPSDCF